MVKQTQQSCCTQLAIASVPMQVWREVYRPETAFMNGTIFPELNLPYTVQGNNSSAGFQRRANK